ncbi:hypothetical protein [Gordonia sp. (in: high G+C Gram-positive bacteria)]|uniref:hypothetical protein n=1 Tax=Gordonia sp. (in: high G+C Gram-positive bacteria) TaxID=84139 RepID=UPI003526F72C
MHALHHDLESSYAGDMFEHVLLAEEEIRDELGLPFGCHQLTIADHDHEWRAARPPGVSVVRSRQTGQMTIPVPSFQPGTIEAVARAVGAMYSGTDLTQMLVDSHLPDPFGEGSTKWRRLDASLRQKQNELGDGRAVIGLIHAAMSPDRTLSRRAQAAVARDELSQVNRPGMSGDSVPWEGWSHGREYVEEVHGRAA